MSVSHGNQLQGYDQQFDEMYKKMNRKADATRLNEFKAEFKRFALYDDFKDLYNKTLVPVQKIQKDIYTYGAEHQ